MAVEPDDRPERLPLPFVKCERDDGLERPAGRQNAEQVHRLPTGEVIAGGQRLEQCWYGA